MRTFSNAIMWLAVVSIVLSPGWSFAEVPSTNPPEHRLAGFVDLTNGNVVILAPFAGCLSVVNAPTDSNGDGWQEAVLRLTMDPAGGGPCSITEAAFVLDYEGVPCGWTLNIGDSASNNGFGGDGGTQENDAEFHINGNIATAYRSDFGGSDRVSTQEMSLTNGGARVIVSDGTVGVSGQRTIITDSSLFALNGQADSGSGGVNYDVYIGLNRVVSGPGDRLGAGLARVLITVK